MPRIPRHFHFVYGLKEQTEPFHLVHYLCLESCRRVNRPDKITLYLHHEPYGDYWDLIRPKIETVRVPLNPHVSRTSYQDPLIGVQLRYAHHADFVRLEKLIEHGGVYADIDTLFLRPIPDSLYERSFVIGREDDVVDQMSGKLRRSLCNAFLMAEKGSEFARIWLGEMPGALNGSWTNHSCQLAYELSEVYPDRLHVEDSSSFYPYMWTPEGLRNLLDEDHNQWGAAYSVHLWSHMWWSPDWNEYSRLHYRQITEGFIRWKNTTYNRAARPFLPRPSPLRWLRGRMREVFRIRPARAQDQQPPD